MKHLIHICCAPDLAVTYFSNMDGSKGDVYFYNPNILPSSEYNLRAEMVRKLSKNLNLNFWIEDYNFHYFGKYLKYFKNFNENGSLCRFCIYIRLKKTAEFAKKNAYTSFSTTLTASPKKDISMVNYIGKVVEKQTGVKYVPSFYRKGPHYNEASVYYRNLGLYRQTYCGCAFSLREKLNEERKDREKRQRTLEELGLRYDIDIEELKYNNESLDTFLKIVPLVKPKKVVIPFELSKEIKIKDGKIKIGKQTFKVEVEI